jgi:hypothetical protein
VLVIGLVVALVTTLLESSTGHGLDNLVVPLGAYAFLALLQPLGMPALLIHLSALAGVSFTLGVFVLPRRRAAAGGNADVPDGAPHDLL